MAKKKNLKIARGDLDKTISQLILLLEGTGGSAEDIAAISEIGDIAPMTQKGQLSKRVRKAKIPANQPLSAMEELAAIISGKGGARKSVPADLERRVLEELPESIRGPLESEVLIPQRDAAKNERLLKRKMLRDAPTKPSGGTKAATARSEMALRQKDLIAMEEDLVDEFVKAGLSEDAARARAESMREEFFEAERKGKPRDPSRTLKAVAQGTDSTRRVTSTGEPIRQMDMVVRERDRVGPAMSEDMLGRKETPSLGGTKTDELGRRQTDVFRSKKGATFSIADQANYSEFVFEPGTGKAANAFSIKRINTRTGQPVKFTKDSQRVLASIVGSTKLIQDGGQNIRYISAESLLKAMKSNPELGALIDNPEFIKMFSRSSAQTKRDLEVLRAAYSKAGVAEGASDELKGRSELKRKRLVADANRIKGDPVPSKAMTKKQRKKITENAAAYDRKMKALRGKSKPSIKGPIKAGSPLITKGMSLKMMPLLAIAAAVKGMK